MKLLWLLPNKFQEFLPEQEASDMAHLWKTWGETYLIISSEISSYDSKADEFINCFLQMGKKYPGMQKRNITPYMHIVIFDIS